MNKQDRRKEQREVCEFLRSDLYERDRDYSSQEGSQSYTCEVGEVPVDHETEMLWGSPIGWRVKIGFEGDQLNDPEQWLTLTICGREGNVFAGPVKCQERGEAYAWLQTTLP